VKTQRGIANGWLYLIGLVVLIAAITGLVVALNAHDAAIDQKGYDRGVKDTTASYAKRDNEALRLKAARITELENSYRKLEQENAARLAKIDADRQKEKARDDAKHKAEIASIRAGAIVLRDPGEIGRAHV
jgi:hypothetical protein